MVSNRSQQEVSSDVPGDEFEDGEGMYASILHVEESCEKDYIEI